jgi:hypothetical protein
MNAYQSMQFDQIAKEMGKKVNNRQEGGGKYRKAAVSSFRATYSSCVGPEK